mmetsp:Transcript_88819/g.176576  ORF Transcript_88819/g.176576 Transcript_88819/m.176576 type:complete len:259 (-) Transcript_88819:763-1539(-)
MSVTAPSVALLSSCARCCNAPRSTACGAGRPGCAGRGLPNKSASATSRPRLRGSPPSETLRARQARTASNFGKEPSKQAKALSRSSGVGSKSRTPVPMLRASASTQASPDCALPASGAGTATSRTKRSVVRTTSIGKLSERSDRARTSVASLGASALSSAASFTSCLSRGSRCNALSIVRSKWPSEVLPIPFATRIAAFAASCASVPQPELARRDRIFASTASQRSIEAKTSMPAVSTTAGTDDRLLPPPPSLQTTFC